jgi:hypothetical protein
MNLEILEESRIVIKTHLETNGVKFMTNEDLSNFFEVVHRRMKLNQKLVSNSTSPYPPDEDLSCLDPLCPQLSIDSFNLSPSQRQIMLSHGFLNVEDLQNVNLAYFIKLDGVGIELTKKFVSQGVWRNDPLAEKFRFNTPLRNCKRMNVSKAC